MTGPARGEPLPEPAAEGELRAIVRVANAVAGAQRLDEVLDVAAQACVGAMGASTIALVRWDPDPRQARVVVRAGALAPGEEPRPERELLALEERPLLRRLLDRGLPYLVEAASTGSGPEGARLRAENRSSELGAGIFFGEAVWGVLLASTPAGEPPLTEAALAFFAAVTVQVAAAVGRAERFARMTTLAFEDPLTGLPNRRAAEERLAAAVRRATPEHPVTVIFCDLDRLKEVNDEAGHDAGDAALRDVGSALRDAARARGPAAMAARLGGDEFCVLLEGLDAGEARALYEEAQVRLDARRPPLALSGGAVTQEVPPVRVADVLRAADAAQYAAKRAGGGRLYVAEAVDVAGREAPIAHATRRRLRDAPNVDRERLVRDVLAVLDGPQADAAPAERLAAVGAICAAAAGFDLWAVLVAPAGAEALRPVLVQFRGQGDPADLRFRPPDRLYRLDLLPGGAKTLEGGGFAVATREGELEPETRALLAEGGWTAVTGAGAPGGDGDRHVLVLLAGDDAGRPVALLPELRLFVREAVAGARPARARPRQGHRSRRS